MTERMVSNPYSPRVKHIASQSLISCDFNDDPKMVFAQSDMSGYDQIPVKKGRSIVGVIERKSEAIRYLDENLLVSEDENLNSLIFTMKRQCYRLVISGSKISGIVTWSDLLKPPVLLLAYESLAHLELFMNSAIHLLHPVENNWLRIIDAYSMKKINGRMKKAKKDNLDLPAIELADFSHKAQVIRPLLRRHDFDSELKKLVELRNITAHVKKVMCKNSDLDQFIEQLSIVKKWTQILSDYCRSSGNPVIKM
jgi:hypothetical protein